MEEQENKPTLKKCIKYHKEKDVKFYASKCIDCYNQERSKFYHIKKKKINDLIFINNPINDLSCCEFINNDIHRERIKDIITELENIINYY